MYNSIMKQVVFMADKCQVSTNQAGGNTKIAFHTGEYELSNIAKLLLIPNEVGIKVTVEWDE